MGVVDAGTVVDTTGDPSWVPVRVTARLAEPVLNLDAHPLHLDGPAAFGAYLAHTADHGACALPPFGPDSCVDFALPIATWTRPAPGLVHPLALAAEAGMVWGWACSAAVYSPAAWTTVQVRRRPAVDEAARYTRDAKWHLSAGPTKARDVPHAAVITPEICWWALADPDALRRLLGRVRGLGRLTRHGNGRVLSWQVDVDDDARDRWRERTWPDPAGQPGTIRAPYHHPSRRMTCRSA